MNVAEADRAARHAALALSLTLPGDIVLYLLLPLYPEAFGVTLPEVGLLLAANRLVRIVGYQWVASLYAMCGPRLISLLAVLAAIASTLGYAVLSGVWALLAMRLIWGLAFAGLNIANHALATAAAEGAARRAGRARAIVAAGPTLALLGGAALCQVAGPQVVFLVLGLVALPALLFAACLPHAADGKTVAAPSLAWPTALNLWAFCIGFALDGIFIVGLAIAVAAQQSEGAILAAGAAMALRYALEIVLSPLAGSLAQHTGARPLLIGVSLGSALGLALIAAAGHTGSDALLWAGLLLTIMLRAALTPLPAPVVAEAYPGPARVPAMAAQSTWRDIGAGTGPLAAGFLLAAASPVLTYGGAALLVIAASLAVMGSRPRRPL
ncbi:MAG: MFS transporter [Actinobacteria bacterium]|nr:MFS transporter [Actinomycetota bacterium]